ncbi:hypothetical protein [Oxynema aestuarii]|uniref:Uncharacterized protein n=1 Tax=Oxynema aestuarii AP17 TaxID=2064643 RepID=A0A6H1U1W1_9CYAN|nr:hypothetical protein [Oxynema aestuarii]QIZ72824.1 hypothetical protein HCG48_21310 [Oxynema aestuarii AP17]
MSAAASNKADRRYFNVTEGQTAGLDIGSILIRFDAFLAAFFCNIKGLSPLSERSRSPQDDSPDSFGVASRRSTLRERGLRTFRLVER